MNRHQGGAARRQKYRPSWRERLRWLVRGFSMLSLMAVLMGVLWGGEQVFRKLDVPISVIAIKGEFSHVNQDEIQHLVEPLIDGGILSLDLAQIRSELELQPWVETVTVRRQWPGGLVISVVEEVPIARWGKQGFLNSRGEMLEIADNSKLKHLPLLQGDENAERSIMKSYREIAQLLQPVNLKISGLKRDPRGAWWLSLSNGLELVVGRDQVMEKMRRFLLVWVSVLKDKAGQVGRVDIRYDNGIAVRWNEKTAVTTMKQPIAQEHMAQKDVVKRFVMQTQGVKQQAVRELTIAPEKPGKV
ncbi:MAG: cell division protein FtsQ/DivIB [Porticoccus sp.]|nr:cell division protein FtsQ/DivIB [Porticoccus sp.]